FGVFVAFAFNRRGDGLSPIPAVSIEPGAVVVTLGGTHKAYDLSRETVSVSFKEEKLYSNGSLKFLGLVVDSQEKNGDGHFIARAREGSAAKDYTEVVMTGDVQLESKDIRARAEHATYTKSDNTVRAPGPFEITEGKTLAKGVGMTFDRERDVVAIA